MDRKWNTQYIKLDSLMTISRGNEEKIVAYLTQFKTLVSERIQKLIISLEGNNKLEIRKILHNMSPQLQFFEVPSVIDKIKRIELEHDAISNDELYSETQHIIKQLEHALEEVNDILNNNIQKI